MARYTDVDALIKCIPREEYSSRFAVANAPIADVAEVKHGEWIFGFDEETGERDLKAWTCSLCGEKYPWQPNFCPHCGARMNGKETEDAEIH